MHKQMGISEVYAKKWFNEGKRFLSYEYDTACKKNTLTFNVLDESLVYNLPVECLRIKKVSDENGNDYISYAADDTTIRFSHKGTYPVVYLMETADFAGQTTTPEIRPQFWPALAIFIASRELADIKPSKSADLYAEFLASAASVDKRLKRMSKSTNNPRPVPKFR